MASHKAIQHRNQKNSRYPRTEAIIIQVQPAVHFCGAHYNGGMKHSCHNAGSAPKLTGYRGKPHSKQSGKLDPGSSMLVPTDPIKEVHSRQNRKIIFGMRAESGKSKGHPHGSHHRSRKIPSHQQNICDAYDSYESHIHQRRPRSIH